ncbi:MAG: ABC transporter ATP-binding protein [Flavobacteriales bacterium]|nr:ABC transporter ATP-binding protein [Flavobacteriales bacterium]MCB9447529.1 ABC transporter ATP-binding protein [Flavobacteriales bacterium]
MSQIVIQAEDVSKLYRLGVVGANTMADDLNRLWARIRGKEDPILKVGEVNARNEAGASNYVWALRNVNFELEQGEVMGVIGKNGAGKSTLLKILSQVTKPTTGRIGVKGRIASMLEVGTGFHPELTGRENVFLNGAILGMTKKEIRGKLDEIISFSGVERYIDTPAKRYSSGMKVRLGFAVAAHLEPEILIVDEVLAVGDVEFQRRCVEKMQEVARQGKTILFVSHNMASIKSLCTRCIHMENGMVKFDGDVEDAIDLYIKSNAEVFQNGQIPQGVGDINTGQAEYTSVKLLNEQREAIDDVYFFAPIRLELGIVVHETVESANLVVRIFNSSKVPMSNSYLLMDRPPVHLEKGKHVVRVEIGNRFQPGSYYVSLAITSAAGKAIQVVNDVLLFNILQVSEAGGQDFKFGKSKGGILAETKWEIQSIQKNEHQR